MIVAEYHSDDFDREEPTDNERRPDLPANGGKIGKKREPST
jgi:hypothetical protein